MCACVETVYFVLLRLRVYKKLTTLVDSSGTVLLDVCSLAITHEGCLSTIVCTMILSLLLLLR